MLPHYNKKGNAKILFNILNVFVYELVFLLSIMTGYINYYFFYSNGYFVFFFMYLVLFLVAGKMLDSYELGETTTTDIFLSHSLTLLFSGFFIYLVLCLIGLRMLPIFPILRMVIIQFVIAALLLLLETRYLHKTYPPVKLVAIYGDEHYDLLGKINNPKELSISIIHKIKVNELNNYSLNDLFKDADGVLTSEVHHENKKTLFKYCYEHGLLIYDVPSITDMLLASSDILHLVDTPVLKINKFGPMQAERMVKRIIDIVGSLFLIIITSPVMFIVAILVKLQDGGEIFYKQTRLTENQREFKMVKFRSMIMNAESKTGVVLAKENDNRITPLGKFIRKTRFDELPQLFNIFVGDMSFIGPRPERPEIYDEICKEFPEFRYRLVVKAGLTGYAQVYGKYSTSLRDKLLLDLYYIENYSLIDDIKLLILTIKVVFSKDAAEGVKNEK